MKKKQTDGEISRIKGTVIPPSDEVNRLLTQCNSSPIKTGIHLDELLRRPELSYDLLEKIDTGRVPLPRSVRVSAEIQIKYEGYIKRELLEVEKARRLEEKHIPDSIDYKKILGLRLEAVEKLSAIRPLNIGQASRISGVSPADIGVLLIYLSGQGKKPD